MISTPSCPLVIIFLSSLHILQLPVLKSITFLSLHLHVMISKMKMSEFLYSLFSLLAFFFSLAQCQSLTPVNTQCSPDSSGTLTCSVPLDCSPNSSTGLKAECWSTCKATVYLVLICSLSTTCEYSLIIGLK